MAALVVSKNMFALTRAGSASLAREGSSWAQFFRVLADLVSNLLLKISELVKVPRPKSHKLYCFDWNSSAAFVFSSTSFIRPLAFFSSVSFLFLPPIFLTFLLVLLALPPGQISIAVLSIRTPPLPPLLLFNFVCSPCLFF